MSEARSVMLARRPRLALGGIAALRGCLPKGQATACNEAMEIYFLSDQGSSDCLSVHRSIIFVSQKQG